VISAAIVAFFVVFPLCDAMSLPQIASATLKSYSVASNPVPSRKLDMAHYCQ
jgi:hypothetical protein